MIWTKSKRALEQLLAESVRKRVQYHMTRYGPGLSYYMTRAWVTWDGKEIANMSTIKAEMEIYENKQRAALVGENIEKRPDPLSRDDFERAVEVYLDSPIEAALDSDDPIVKALAMFDRRLGKRRLQKLAFGEADHPMVKQFYTLRCEAEGLHPAEFTC